MHAFFSFQFCFAISLLLLSGGYFLLPIVSNFSFYCFCFFLIGLGSGGAEILLIKINSQNFPIKNRGVIIGIIVFALPCSGLIWSAIYLYPLGENLNRFFLSIATSSTVLGVLALLFVENLENCVPVSLNEESLHHEDFYEKVDITGYELLKSGLFWLLFFTEFINYGSTVSLFSEMAQALEDYSSWTQKVQYTYIAVNTISRIGAGYLCDISSNVLRRPFWLLFSALSIFIGQISFAIYPNLKSFWVAAMFTAAGYGAAVCIVKVIIMISYGPNHFGINNGLLHLGAALGSLCFTKVSDVIIHSVNCNDSLLCYRYSFVFSASFLLVAIVLSILIVKFYPVLI